MAKQTINIGTVANDRSGDDLRTAFDKANDNFTELYNLHGANYGVFAYLPAAQLQTIAEADTYQAISGAFTNDPVNGFEVVSSPIPGIMYTGSESLYFEIDMHAVFAGAANGVTVTFSIAKNGTTVASSAMSGYSKTAGELYSISGTCVVLIEEDDVITLQVKTDTGGNATIHNYTTTIRPFSVIPE